MIDLHPSELRDCEAKCLYLSEFARELRGENKHPIFETDAFKKVAERIREKHPAATNRDILAYILRKFAHKLRQT